MIGCLTNINEEFFQHLLLKDPSDFSKAEQKLFSSLKRLIPQLKARDMLVTELIRSHQLSLCQLQRKPTGPRTLFTKSFTMSDQRTVQGSIQYYTTSAAGVYSTSTLIKCMDCDIKPQNSMENFLRHVCRKPKDKPHEDDYKCPKCGRICQNAASLDTHVKTCSLPREISVAEQICKTCPYRDTNEYNFSIHNCKKQLKKHGLAFCDECCEMWSKKKIRSHICGGKAHTTNSASTSTASASTVTDSVQKNQCRENRNESKNSTRPIRGSCDKKPEKQKHSKHHKPRAPVNPSDQIQHPKLVQMTIDKPRSSVLRDPFTKQSSNDAKSTQRITSRPEQNNFRCVHCAVTCISENALRTHDNYCTKKVREYICRKCSKVFNFPDQLTDHYKICEQPHRCARCTRTYNTEKEYRDHYEQCYNTRICHTCEKEFENTDAYQDHMNTKHPDKFPRALQCDICPYTSYTEQMYRIHMETRHGVKHKTN